MFDNTSRPRVTWWTVGAVLALVVGAALLAFTGALVTALFLYYVSRPVYRRLRPRLGRSLAAAGAIVALAVPLVLLLAYTAAIVVQELQALDQEVGLGPLRRAVSPYFEVSTVVQNPSVILENPDVLAGGRALVDTVAAFIPLVLTFVLHLFVALAATFYLLKDGARLADWARETFGSETGLFGDYVRAVDDDLSNIYFGNILNAVFAAIIAAITYYALNLVAPAGMAIPFPALLGMLVGAASLIPAVGMKIVYPPVAVLILARAVAGGDPLWFPVAFFVASAVVVDFIPDIILRPFVSGRNLHVGLVMIAYIVGPGFFGWYGLFLGPLLLVLAFHFVRRILPELLDGGPLRPTPAITEARGGAEYLDAEGGAEDDATEGDES
jgi:predicted PurR-regulated permease PerM